MLQWRHRGDDDDVLQETSEHAFEELFAAAYVALDQIWLDTKASYMQFSQVLKCVVVRVELACTHLWSCRETQGRVEQALVNASVSEFISLQFS